MRLAQMCLGILAGAEAVHQHEAHLQRAHPSADRHACILLLVVSFRSARCTCTWDPNSLRVCLICSAMRSRKVLPSFTTRRLLAFSRPMDVPSPPLSFNTAVCDSNFCSQPRRICFKLAGYRLFDATATQPAACKLGRATRRKLYTESQLESPGQQACDQRQLRQSQADNGAVNASSGVSPSGHPCQCFSFRQDGGACLWPQCLPRTPEREVKVGS